MQPIPLSGAPPSQFKGLEQQCELPYSGMGRKPAAKIILTFETSNCALHYRTMETS